MSTVVQLFWQFSGSTPNRDFDLRGKIKRKVKTSEKKRERKKKVAFFEDIKATKFGCEGKDEQITTLNIGAFVNEKKKPENTYLGRKRSFPVSFST